MADRLSIGRKYRIEPDELGNLCLFNSTGQKMFILHLRTVDIAVRPDDVVTATACFYVEEPQG